MEIQVGDILCLKLTGETVIILPTTLDAHGTIYSDKLKVRRPVGSSQDGITHVEDFFLPFELETEEEHLQREAKAMLLKYKVQRQFEKDIETLRLEDLEQTRQKGVDHTRLLN